MLQLFQSWLPGTDKYFIALFALILLPSECIFIIPLKKIKYIILLCHFLSNYDYLVTNIHVVLTMVVMIFELNDGRQLSLMLAAVLLFLGSIPWGLLLKKEMCLYSLQIFLPNCYHAKLYFFFSISLILFWLRDQMVFRWKYLP